MTKSQWMRTAIVFMVIAFLLGMGVVYLAFNPHVSFYEVEVPKLKLVEMTIKVPKISYKEELLEIPKITFVEEEVEIPRVVEEQAEVEPEISPTPTTALTTAPVTEEEDKCLAGVTTEKAQALTGISVQRLATECSAFVWRGLGATEVATCPKGWICTLDVVDDIVVVHEGIGQKANIYAGTFREPGAYPPDDAAHDVCAIYRKEKQFGLAEVPSFEVRFQPVPGGVQSCN